MYSPLKKARMTEPSPVPARAALPASYRLTTSPPAQKAFSPAPWMTTAFTSGSASQARSCGSNSRIMPSVRAFSAFGRLSVTRAMAPRRSNRISALSLIGLIFLNCRWKGG